MAFWVALALLLAGVLGGIAYVVLRAFALWRQLKRTGGAFGDEAARISEASAQIQGHLDRASTSSGRLAEASERLALSRARLDVQLQAVREARYTVRRMLWFLPGV